MKQPTISVMMISYAGDKYIIDNCLRSLVDLHPEELCILDTTLNEKKSKEYQQWLTNKCKEYGLPLKLGYRKWDSHYGESHNMVMGMCSSDWMVSIDSDEMLTKEAARDMRSMLSHLPTEALCVRVLLIELLDDEHCLSRDVWTKRMSMGTHARLIKRGAGRYERAIHEIFNYPGRTTIPFNSPKHPKKDWWHYYFIHLWLYKDNPKRRWINSENDFYGDTNKILRKRGWEKMRIPNGLATWVQIEWSNLNMKLRAKNG